MAYLIDDSYETFQFLTENSNSVVSVISGSPNNTQIDNTETFYEYSGHLIMEKESASKFVSGVIKGQFINGLNYSIYSYELNGSINSLTTFIGNGEYQVVKFNVLNWDTKCTFFDVGTGNYFSKIDILPDGDWSLVVSKIYYMAWVDKSNDYALESYVDDEIYKVESLISAGTSGVDGTSGINGTSGSSGVSGTNPEGAMIFRGQWNTNNSYVVDDFVHFEPDGSLYGYVCIVDTPSPSASPTDWMVWKCVSRVFFPDESTSGTSGVDGNGDVMNWGTFANDRLDITSNIAFPELLTGFTGFSVRHLIIDPVSSGITTTLPNDQRLFTTLYLSGSTIMKKGVLDNGIVAFNEVLIGTIIEPQSVYPWPDYSTFEYIICTSGVTGITYQLPIVWGEYHLSYFKNLSGGDCYINGLDSGWRKDYVEDKLSQTIKSGTGVEIKSYANGEYFFTNTNDKSAQNQIYEDGLILSKSVNTGIKLDSTTPQFGWKDLVGQLVPRVGGGPAPSLTSLRGTNVKVYAFSANDVIDNMTFHLPHDYVPNSQMFIHTHWTHNGTSISGNLSYEYYITYSKGYNQTGEIFNSEITVTDTIAITDINSHPRWSHIITEKQFTSNTGSTNTLDVRKIEVDGLLIVGLKVTVIPTITGGSVDRPLILTIDLHYQSNGVMGTYDKNYPFYQ